MKRLKVLFATLAVATIITAAFAFTTNDSKPLAVKYYQYIGPTQTPASAAEVSDVDNWQIVTVLPDVTGDGPDFAAIEFNDVNTTFAQARTILANRFSLGYTDNAIYTSGTQSVKLYLKN